MTKNTKWGDKEIAAFGTAAVILIALLTYWVGEFESTVELLELAYGSFKFFNNPLEF